MSLLNADKKKKSGKGKREHCMLGVPVWGFWKTTVAAWTNTSTLWCCRKDLGSTDWLVEISVGILEGCFKL